MVKEDLSLTHVQYIKFLLQHSKFIQSINSESIKEIKYKIQEVTNNDDTSEWFY